VNREYQVVERGNSRRAEREGKTWEQVVTIEGGKGNGGEKGN